MTIEQDIYDGLAAHAGLSALVDTRIYEIQLPEGTGFPCVTYQQISGAREQTVPGTVVSLSPRYQITAWSDDRVEADEVADEIELAAVSLIGRASFKDVTIAGSRHRPDPDAKLFAKDIDAILLVAA